MINNRITVFSRQTRDNRREGETAAVKGSEEEKGGRVGEREMSDE